MVRVSLPSAKRVPNPTGVNTPPMPAPAARRRSARVPCGYNLNGQNAGLPLLLNYAAAFAHERKRRDDFGDTLGVGQLQDTFRAVPIGEIADARQIAGVGRQQGGQQRGWFAAACRAADKQSRAVVDICDGGGGSVV